MSRLRAFFISLRPWSFPVTVSAVLIGAAIAYHTTSRFHPSIFFLSLLGGLSAHAFGNIINTYYDFLFGLDRKDNRADDRAIVDGMVTTQEVKMIAVGCLVVGIGCIAALIPHVLELGVVASKVAPSSSSSLSPLTSFLLLVIVGLFLAYAYTGSPFKLKYRRLGDIVIFLCFGPLLVSGAYFVHTGTLSLVAIIYSIPVGLVTEAILHANNSRDIDIDLKAGAMTLANTIGFDASERVFQGMYAAAYACLPLFVLWSSSGWFVSLIFLLPCVLLPQLLKGPLYAFASFRPFVKGGKRVLNKKVDDTTATSTIPEPQWDICDQCGQFSFGFGALLSIAILVAGV